MSLRAGLVLVLCALSSTMSVATAGRASAETEDGSRDASRAAFRRGVSQAKAGEWTLARASFEQAYALYPHPSILLNLGIAELRAGDPVAAERDLVRFFSDDSETPPDELASAREALSEARAKIGTLKVFARPGQARVLVDGKPIGGLRTATQESVAAASGVLPGTHVVRVEAEGFASTERRVDVGAGKTTSVDVSLVPSLAVSARHDEAPHTTTRAIVGWSLAGLSAGALLTSGLTALRASSLATDYRDPESPRFQSAHTRDVGVGFRTTADIALGVGVVSGAVALVLLLTRSSSESTATARASGPLGLWVVPTFGPSSAQSPEN